MSPNSRKNWYKTNKGNYTPNRKRTFDNAGMYNESQESVAHDSSDDLWDYVTTDEW